jgi:hypothetical protein
LAKDKHFLIIDQMPAVKNIGGPYRLFFYGFDCNEPMHIHVQREGMVCKFWDDHCSETSGSEN